MSHDPGISKRPAAAQWPYLDTAPGTVLAFAHRGGAEHPEITGLENTRKAFAHAVALGYRYLETDVHVTRDGVLLAFHDSVLDRVTDRTGAIAELTYDEVRQARIGGREPIPTMRELLLDFPEARFNIDIKSAGAVDPLAALIDECGAAHRVLIGSFSLSRLRAFRRRTSYRIPTSAAAPEVAALVLLPRIVERVLERFGRRLTAAVAAQVPHQHRRIPVVTAGFVAKMHASDRQVHVWTIDDPAEMNSLLDLGVDGLMTDRTDILKAVLNERDQWEAPQ